MLVRSNIYIKVTGEVAFYNGAREEFDLYEED